MAKKEGIRKLFDNIAPDYDRLNHILSLNIDKGWRKKAVRQLADENRPMKVLDVACGTADFTIEIAQKIAPGSVVTGVDISEGMMELIVRLRSLAGRRQVQTAPVPQTYRIGEFIFHPDILRLEYAGTSEELSPREAKILELLCASKGETLYTRPLLLEIWGDDDFFNSRSLQVFISKLRRRLEPDPRIRIVNVRGEGYKLLVNE